MSKMASHGLLLSASMQSELNVKASTNTPWWHGLYTLFKVCACGGPPRGGGRYRQQGLRGGCLEHTQCTHNHTCPYTCTYTSLCALVLRPPAPSHPPQYRTLRNWRDPGFLGARLGDKLFTGLVMMSLWYGAGEPRADPADGCAAAAADGGARGACLWRRSCGRRHPLSLLPFAPPKKHSLAPRRQAQH